MVAASTTWTQSRPKSISCTKCLLSPESHDWTGIPAIPLSLDDFFETTRLNRPYVVTSATWKTLTGLHRADCTPTAPEPAGNTADVVIPQREQSETVQNDPIKFMQDFDQNDDITDTNDSLKIPMQAS